jgi:hypothetical protein
VKKKHTGLKITLGILGALIVLCGVGGVVVARPYLSQYPATLSTPDSIDGMNKLDDPTFQQISDEMVAELKSQANGSSTLGAIYAPGDDPKQAVILAGVTALFVNTGSQIDSAFSSMGTGEVQVTNVASVDAGSMGGSARCGGAESSDISIGVCVWADHGSVGLVMAFGRTPAQTADLMRTIRPIVLHRN